MRIIAQFNDLEKAQRISSYLTSEGIHNELESEPVRDWGSEEYGTVKCALWIVDEDDVGKAREILSRYQDTLPPLIVEKKEKPAAAEIPETPLSPYPAPIQQPLGYVTFYVLVLCTLIYIMAEWSTPALQFPLPKLPYTPLFSSPTKKELMYDYPKPYEIVDELTGLYGVPALVTPDKLPPEGQELYRSVFQTPMWEGAYRLIVKVFSGKQLTENNFSAPLFEKEQEGEVWRLFTPIFLHADIFHLIFNMLWVVVLGRQMELRIGSRKLLLFILISALFSNTAQYLMSGPNFIGFSGVLCAMFAFIWQRQLRTPWEGYQLQKPTIKFMFIFLFGMAAIQLISFGTEVFFGTEISPGIANTAHLSGLLIGYVLSFVPLFKLK